MNRRNTVWKIVSGRLLPSFLGIGAMRSGTTLLHRLLATNADVYVPSVRKEIHFFDKNHGKGLGWYASFFPEEEHASKYRAIGEITPRYVFEKTVPHLVKRDLPEARFILMLRNPVDRLYSHYRFVSARSKRKVSFREFASGNRLALCRGFYAEQLSRWLNLFEQDRFQVFLFEEFVGNPDAATDKLAAFLGVDANGFDQRIFEHKAAASLTPRLPHLYRAGIWLQKFLLEKNLDRTYAVLRAGRGILKLRSRSSQVGKLTAQVRCELYEAYAKEISDLEQLLERNLDIWRPGGFETSAVEKVVPAEASLVR